jgi:tRNA wybutosine-synthesizing protein 1
MLPDSVLKTLKRQKYRVAGRHSAVKLCHWAKESLTSGRVCYKQDFYGIKSHRCLQMTPCVAWCQQKCLFCWREHEFQVPAEEWDDPDTIINACEEGQRKLLEGYYGNDAVDRKKLDEAQQPNQAAISLAGEPTMYAHIGDLVEAFTSRKYTTFLVTNGLLPAVLAGLHLPTQLYVSLDAPDEATQKKLNVPFVKDAWKRLNETLELLNSLETRKALRITLVKGWNDFDPRGYAKLIDKSNADFVEVKSYMFVGASRQRLSFENMPSHSETKAFAESVLKELPGYKLVGEKPDSKVVLLSSGAKPQKIPGI